MAKKRKKKQAPTPPPGPTARWPIDSSGNVIVPPHSWNVFPNGGYIRPDPNGGGIFYHNPDPKTGKVPPPARIAKNWSEKNIGFAAQEAAVNAEKAEAARIGSHRSTIKASRPGRLATVKKLAGKGLTLRKVGGALGWSAAALAGYDLLAGNQREAEAERAGSLLTGMGGIGLGGLETQERNMETYLDQLEGTQVAGQKFKTFLAEDEIRNGREAVMRDMDELSRIAYKERPSIVDMMATLGGM